MLHTLCYLCGTSVESSPLMSFYLGLCFEKNFLTFFLFFVGSWARAVGGSDARTCFLFDKKRRNENSGKSVCMYELNTKTV